MFTWQPDHEAGYPASQATSAARLAPGNQRYDVGVDVRLEAKVYALQNGVTLGELINRSLEFFMQEAEFEE